MDRHIVFSKELTKADTLVLKNLEADIQDVAARPSNGRHTEPANGSSHHHPLLPPSPFVARGRC